jgi:hypothetical protein
VRYFIFSAAGVMFSSIGRGEPAHCTIQAYGKTVYDQNCELRIENNIAKMLNSDGSYVTISPGYNGDLYATIHAIHDAAEPKLIPIPLTKDGECYHSEDGLSRFCGRSLTEGERGPAESAAPPGCYPKQSGSIQTCQRWSGDISIAIVPPPLVNAETKDTKNDLYEFLYLSLPKLLKPTQEKTAIIASGGANLFILWDDDLKQTLISNSSSLNKINELFSKVDGDVPSKFSEMKAAIDAGSKCEAIVANIKNTIVYALVLMQSDHLKMCFAPTVGKALGVGDYEGRPTDLEGMAAVIRRIYEKRQ